MVLDLFARASSQETILFLFAILELFASLDPQEPLLLAFPYLFAILDIFAILDLLPLRRNSSSLFASLDLFLFAILDLFARTSSQEFFIAFC